VWSQYATYDSTKARQNVFPKPLAAPVTTQTCDGRDQTRLERESKRRTPANLPFHTKGTQGSTAMTTPMLIRLDDICRTSFLYPGGDQSAPTLISSNVIEPGRTAGYSFSNPLFTDACVGVSSLRLIAEV
jgi:hypothetical protein